MTEQEIISKVRNIMNEEGTESSLSMLSEDTLKIDDYIKNAIADAVNIVDLNSTVRCVNMISGEGSTLTTTDGNGGTIALPDDYVALIALKIANWKKIVCKALPVSSEEYKCETNEYTRGGINNPIVFESYGSTGKVLEYFTPGSGISISVFKYEARYNSTDGLNLVKDEPLAIAVCYMVASLVYSRFENPNTAKEMQTISLNLIPK